MKYSIAICTLMFIAPVLCSQAPELPEVCTPSSRSATSMKETHDCLINNHVFGVMFHNDTCNYLKTAIACEPQNCCDEIKSNYDNTDNGNGQAMRRVCGDGIKINCKRYESAGNAHRPMAGLVFLSVICICMAFIMGVFE
jgi:hypothetical protein